MVFKPYPKKQNSPINGNKPSGSQQNSGNYQKPTFNKPVMVKICGLWENESNAGGTYFSGATGDIKFLIFRNTKKELDTHPDFNLFISQNFKYSNKPKEESAEAEENFEEDEGNL